MDLYPRIYAFAFFVGGHPTLAGWAFDEAQRDHELLQHKPKPGTTVVEFEVILPPGLPLASSMRDQINEMVVTTARSGDYTATLRYTVPDKQASRLAGSWLNSGHGALA
jgi:hypothetical protein